MEYIMREESSSAGGFTSELLVAAGDIIRASEGSLYAWITVDARLADRDRFLGPDAHELNEGGSAGTR
jgi:hypothetical protein